MTPLFDDDPLSGSRELLEEGAVLLRGFAVAEAPALIEAVARNCAGRAVPLSGDARRLHHVGRDD